MTDDRDIVHHFADFAAEIRYEDLPEAARDAARKSILDTLGVCLAASGMEPAAQAIIEIVRETGGPGQCTLLGFPGKGPALMAALQNGGLAHCLDYDDQTPWGQHAASSVVPAVFALAERRGGISGREMITAVAIGQDIFARLRCNVGWKKDWNLSTVLGVYAGAAAGARVMGLPAAQVGNAIGIASMQCSGIMEMVAGRGSDLRGLYAGFSAKGAVLAAMMAERGVTGIDRMFEGTYGFFNSYFDGRYDRAAILRNLGTEFLGSGTLYKRWPCVGTSHSHMKAIIDIVTENDLSPEDIAEIHLHVGDYHDLMCQPMAERCAPATLADAKFSLPFLVAVAAVRRGMSVTDFSEAGLRDARVLATAAKMRLVVDPALDWKLELPPGRVEVVAKDGRRWLREGQGVPGNADNPMSWDGVYAKFAECASVSAVPIADDRILQAQGFARNLDDLDDATELIRVLG
ncbi:MmgE/PrpD family protein [Paracoccus sp. P2]|uniref:MmgE/PrpD family protein n=1 Tax=Paracoccus sp. P2 TaxID=3248840 RepID=UPI00391F36CA